jgi:hypothetical protein
MKQYKITGTKYEIYHTYEDFTVIEQVQDAAGYRELDDPITNLEQQYNEAYCLSWETLGDVVSTTFCYSDEVSDSRKKKIEAEWKEHGCKYNLPVDLCLTITGPWVIENVED